MDFPRETNREKIAMGCFGFRGARKGGETWKIFGLLGHICKVQFSILMSGKRLTQNI